MMDYDKLRKHCEHNSRLLGRVVNDFLLDYAAGYRGLEKQMEKHFARYKHVLRRFDPGNLRMFKSQWLMHRVFREGGLLEKPLNDAWVRSKLVDRMPHMDEIRESFQSGL